MPPMAPPERGLDDEEASEDGEGVCEVAAAVVSSAAAVVVGAVVVAADEGVLEEGVVV